MKRNFYVPDDAAIVELDLNWDEGYYAIEGKKYNSRTEQQIAWVYLYFDGLQVADMALAYFKEHFTAMPVTVTKEGKQHFRVMIKEVTESEYIVQASDVIDALELAASGRFGMRLNQRLTGFNIIKVEGANS